MNSSDQPHIIRSPISREFAFPVGYELLRDHFGALPQWSDARFYFSAHPTTFASEFAVILQEQEPYRILRVEHQTETDVPAHWSFRVYPVPRPLKSVARAALCDGPFATLREFVVRAPQNWNQYNRSDAIFDPQEGTAIVQTLYEVAAPNV
jgi:hypothetical protein